MDTALHMTGGESIPAREAPGVELLSQDAATSVATPHRSSMVKIRGQDDALTRMRHRVASVGVPNVPADIEVVLDDARPEDATRLEVLRDYVLAVFVHPQVNKALQMVALMVIVLVVINACVLVG